MAVTNGLASMKIEIIANGVAVVEHIDPDVVEDERTVARYIEAATGQEFYIQIELLPEFEFKGECAGFYISIDRVLVDTPMISKNAGFRSIKSKGVEIPGGMVRRYRFADLETIDGGTVNQDEVLRAKDLGSIVVMCGHCNFVQAAEFTNREIGVNNIVSEKALKGKDTSHNIEFMDAEKLSYGQSPFFDSEPVEGEPLPAAVFIFHYRSVDALKSARIIPRTPSPRPPTPLEERDEESLSIEELRELTRKLKEQQQASAKIKREREDEEEAPGGRKSARRSRGNRRVEVDEDVNERERSNSTATLREIEVIELE